MKTYLLGLLFRSVVDLHPDALSQWQTDVSTAAAFPALSCDFPCCLGAELHPMAELDLAAVPQGRKTRLVG